MINCPDILSICALIILSWQFVFATILTYQITFWYLCTPWQTPPAHAAANCQPLKLIHFQHVTFPSILLHFKLPVADVTSTKQGCSFLATPGVLDGEQVGHCVRPPVFCPFGGILSIQPDVLSQRETRQVDFG